MAWTSPRTWVTGELVTAALMNTHLRDNMLVTAPAVCTEAGDMVYASAANAMARLAKGTAYQFMAMKSDASQPVWSDLLVLGPRTELTIASGAITVTGSFHTVDTEGEAASDQLDNIGGGVDGALLWLRSANNARTVTVRDNGVSAGNIALAGDANCSLDSVGHRLVLQYQSSNEMWVELLRVV